MKKMLSLKSIIAIFAIIAFVLPSCNTNDEVQPQIEDIAMLADIPGVLSDMAVAESDESAARKGAPKAPTFATFNAALGSTGLASVFARNNLTVFAPTDEAFRALGLNPGNVRRQPNLREILLYHVVEGRVLSTDLSAGFVPTLNGAAVEISLSGGPKVNDANIIMVDKRARNGVIHGIDAVLLPPDKNLAELALSFAPEFSILVDAVVKTNLLGALTGSDPLTVFAPTNQAFINLGFNDADALIAALGEVGLRNVLLYHVVAGRVFSSDLVDGQEVTALNGGKFTVDLSGPSLIDANNRVSNLIVGLLNVQATNGVIHVIDTVILP
ncbi:MAG: fasciclin domain-containing protein [Cyclobacteriaceae bacterium]|nr:fasciclin domain-containing protein [Cyclobacteriaceae bacterium]